MKLSINGYVVKSYDVKVATPRMVECNEGFQQLGAFLKVLSVGKERQNLVNPIEEEAKEKAAIILAEAENCAQTILEEGRADLDRLRQEVVETAQSEVYAKAQDAGYHAGLLAGEAEGKRLAERSNLLFQLAQHAVQEEYAKVDEDLLHLAIKIAERVVRSSLAVEPKRLVAIIQALTLLPQERLGWRLHVAPDDSRLLEGEQSPCPWVMDESLNTGDCFLECQEGIFDARLDAQLDKLEHTLREELKHGSMEPIDSDGEPD
jgi:flagellar assembly protein FliH